ncbi:hypothetical protein PT7_3485 [Pusillimonas sp. T7-7]|uniref:hypothetical protein n=1 Tax=Pusillimonas sp. (strain T7-7) TaxID=1007105 RepID=UPI000208572D|nr:hypothetical protein [Pusillimonas sp. T7-7]AEC22025.1 hypothetical protein PT7_3485 [Pusillimonas sp. T7-7]
MVYKIALRTHNRHSNPIRQGAAAPALANKADDTLRMAYDHAEKVDDYTVRVVSKVPFPAANEHLPPAVLREGLLGMTGIYWDLGEGGPT